MKRAEMKSTPVPLVTHALRIEAAVLGAMKSQSAWDGEKSQSAWDGDKMSANDYEWRRVA